jgi:hypothetical protein
MAMEIRNRGFPKGEIEADTEFAGTVEIWRDVPNRNSERSPKRTTILESCLTPSFSLQELGVRVDRQRSTPL